MRPAQLIGMVLLLAVIFVGGFFTGRLTGPRQPTLVVGASGRLVTSDVILNRLTRQLSLDTNQQAAFRILLEDMATQIARFPPGSQERYEVFKKSLPQQKALLRPDQYPAFERATKETDRRFQRAMRLRSSRANTSSNEP